MPTNNYVESSFWNFDALFQPQQHPARDAHDTFFLTSESPSHTTQRFTCSIHCSRRWLPCQPASTACQPGWGVRIWSEPAGIPHLVGQAPLWLERLQPSARPALTTSCAPAATIVPAEPAATPISRVPADYVERVKQTHQSGGYGSIGCAYAVLPCLGLVQLMAFCAGVCPGPAARNAGGDHCCGGCPAVLPKLKGSMPCTRTLNDALTHTPPPPPSAAGTGTTGRWLRRRRTCCAPTPPPSPRACSISWRRWVFASSGCGQLTARVRGGGWVGTVQGRDL